MNQKIKLFANNNKLNIIIKNILIIFIIIQPIFDLKIFYNSISTLIRVIFISLFFLYYFFKDATKKKYLLLIYPLLIMIYFIFHHFNALSFNSLVPGNFNYSFLKEGLYFVKMLCPFMLIFSIYKAKLSKKEIFFIIKIIVLFVSIIIIFSNLFMFSYGTYSDEKIKANFFEWFNQNSTYEYLDLASKGLFEFANQISAILLMLLPVIVYLNLKSKNKFNITILCFNVFALTLLCTKVAIFGVVLVFIYTTIIYIIKNRKLKNISPVALVFLFYVLLLPFNPSFSRMIERERVIEAASLAVIDVPGGTEDIMLEETSDTLINDFTTAPITKEQNEISNDYKLSFIENNYEKQKINENFVKNRYPYTYDPDFWYDILTNDYNNKSDFRYLEISMVKRVIEINNNKLDKWLGITYVRIQNIFNIEKDFIMQYYSLGIIGLSLALGPYFIILCYCFVKLLKKKFQSIENIILMGTTICMIFAISYYSGNLLNSLGFTIYFSIPFAIIIKASNNNSTNKMEV